MKKKSLTKLQIMLFSLFCLLELLGQFLHTFSKTWKYAIAYLEFSQNSSLELQNCILNGGYMSGQNQVYQQQQKKPF